MTLEYEGIAIIGMAGRFPGAESVEEFWQNLVAGKESVSFFSDKELAEAGLDGAELRMRGQYVPARGILKHEDCFDAAFFGVHPKEAEVMEPQQRIFLETCWEALERAGYAPGRVQGATGVFAGASRNTYYLHALHRRPDLIELVGPEMVMYGNEKDYLTTRVAYKLGLKGPALNVSTACSTSLVAVCQACQSLLTYQCDMALAGGASVMVPQKRGYYYDEGNIGSPDGHTRTFDARAAGTVFGNGVAVVVLKRLADAVKDGDQIFAVIKGAALNNDGSQRVSFGAPGVEGQSDVIAMAHALAGVDPETIRCVEAHGTATPLGDPIEVAGLTKAFRLGTDARQFCALGSVKTNIGHLDVAAGVAGLIKMALSLHHKVIPASLHYVTPNPKLNLEESPFYVNASLQNWNVKAGVPRRGGVSSFGTGGTNAHVVLEEAPEVPAGGPSRPWQLLVLSAKTPDALERATGNLAQHLKEMASHAGDATSAKLADAAFTLQTGRSEFAHRRIAVCQDPAEATQVLDGRDSKRVFSHRQQLRQPPVVFMFPGQGAQYAGMGAELYRVEPVFRSVVDRCADLLMPVLNTDLRAVLFPASGSEKETDGLLVQTRFTQPALFVIEYALAQLWMSWGIRPASMIGHSVGEYVAACLAGVLSLEDALSLVARRGALVQALPGGAMLAVRLPEEDVLPHLNPELAIAAINSPNLCVVSGPYEAIATLEKKLESQHVGVRHLPTSHAFHSRMMEPALAPFASMLRQIEFGEPGIPYISNVTGRWVSVEQAKSVDYWTGHLREPVRFADGVAELLKDPRSVLLEVGPGQTLSTLARQHPDKSAEKTILSSLPLTGAQEQRGILESLGRLWMAGVEVGWSGFYANETRRRAALPTYPFERTRCWPESPEAQSQSISMSAAASAIFGVTNGFSEQTKTRNDTLRSSRDAAGAVPPAAAHPAIPRKERLLAAVRSLLQDLSGSDLSNVDTSANLLELGLDSLLLTQASHLLQRKFGVAISFRQLMEELGSLDDIASYLDAAMAPEAFAAQPPSKTMQPMAAAPHGFTPAVGGEEKSVLEQLLIQHQQLNDQILQALGRAPAAPPGPTPAALPGAATSQLPVKAHGPFKPIDKGAGSALSDTQSRAIDAIIARYVRRTPASKKLAAENRPALADPRSVAGFNRLWKEMVYPIATARSDGSRVWDVDGNEYIDFVMGFGASLFGHRPPFVVRAVQDQLNLGFEIGPIQPLAGEVAALLKEFTGMDRIGFTNTGSEAVLAATRVARTVTGRDKIAVFAGAYHGIFDEMLFRPHKINGEAAAAPIAPGIPTSALEQVIVLDYGNPESLEILRARGSELAAVLVEPVQSRRLDLQPREFLQELRRITEQAGAALIFDEVVTGFRVQPGGAQAYFGVRADLATYGKVIGGGLPIGVVAGSSRFMDALDGGQWQYGDASFPESGVTFFAGTFVRHPLALAAAKAVLLYLKKNGPELQQRLTERTAQLARDLRTVISEFDAPYRVTQFTSLIQVGFPADQKLAGLLFYLLRERGIHIWENRAFVITTAHTEDDIARLLGAFRESLSEMKAGGLLSPSASPLTAPSSSKEGLAEPQSTEQIVPIGEAFPDSLEAGFPLTEAQTEIWLAAQMSVEAAVAYSESLTLRFSGEFDVERFRAAVRQVVGRHPILLASISADGLSQSVKPGATLDVPFIDLGGLSVSGRESEIAKLIEQETLQPFDVTAGPLLRVKILRLSSDLHAVLWTAHHIICDGWSSGLLISELAKIYSASEQGSQPALDTPQSFKKYVEQNGPDTPEARDSVAYWKQQFAEFPAPLDLPTDRPRPPVRSAKAATTSRVLNASLHRSLKRLAGQQRTTLVVLLMAGLRALLFRLTGQEDLVIGLGAAGQATTGKECLVGHCLNLLPIRARLKAEASFLQNLAEVKASVLDAYDHSACSVGGLLQHLGVPRNPGRSPLVEVIFNLDRDPGFAQFAGLAFECDRNPKRALHFDLFFNFVEGVSGLTLECDYNTDLFEAATIDRWLGHYETLLEAIAAAPTESVAKLPILTERERDQITIEWNKPAIEFPKEKTLPEWFEDQVEKNPEAIALTYESNHLTYRELNRRANQLAHYLKNLGVGPDVLVGLLVERSVEMVVGIIGILKAGGAYLPIDLAYPKDRLAFMLEDANVPILLTQSKLLAELPSCSAKVVCFDLDSSVISRQSESNPHAGSTPDNLAYVIYTSGSTGKPKGTRVTHYNVVRLMQATEHWYHFNERDVWTLFHSHAFDFSVWELWGALFYGGRLVIVPYLISRSPEDFCKLLVSERVTVLNQTPSAFTQLILAEERLGAGARLSLRYVIFGGEALDLQVLKPWFDRHGDQHPLLVNMYGITETTVHVTYRTLSARDLHAGSVIGIPIPDLQVYLLDSHQQPVPIGVAGEIYVGGAGVASGYLNRGELTREKFLPDPFAKKAASLLYRSGDVARYLPNRDIEYLGRADDQVKIRGFRVELGEIEATLLRRPDLLQCVVVALEDESRLKRLVAYVVPKSARAFEPEDLRQYLKKTLPEFMVPSVFVVLEKFPLTPNGKVDRKALPSPSYERGTSAKDLVEPRTETEQALASIWSELLKVENIGVDSNFFDLGGHSLLAIRAVSRIRDLFEVNLSPGAFFTNATIAGLAKAVEEARNSSAGVIHRIKRRSQDGPAPLSFAQERLWFLDQLAAGSPVYNIVDVVEFAKPSKPEVIKRALSELVRRQEALRTAFSESEGQPVQVVHDVADLMLSEVDLAGLGEAQQESEWTRIAQEQGRKPFDLSKAPLVRGTLVRLDEDEYILLLALHHIIADEWSMEVLHQDLHRICEAFAKNQPSPLLELPIQCADFACWQRDWLQGEVLERQTAYWKKELAGVPTILELPTDKPRPAVQRFRGSVEVISFPKGLLEQLKTIGRAEHATLFMTLMASFMALLYRYTGQNDILVGSPISGRTLSETEDLIGFFLNTVVLRGTFSEGLTFRSLLRQVREKALGAYAHQDLPFGHVVAEVAPGRDPSYTPLIQTMFILQNADAISQASRLAGIQKLETGTSKFDLTLFMSETDGGLEGLIEYSTDLFEPATIRRLLDHYQVLLSEIAREPDQSISTLPLLTTDERQLLLREWNDTEVVFPEKDCSLHRLFEKQAQDTPDRIAVVFQQQQWSYRELNERANRLAHCLKEFGVGPNVLLGILLERSVEMVVGLLGTLKAGGAYVPLDPSFPKSRLAHMVEDSGMRVLIAHRQLDEMLPVRPAIIVRLDSDSEVIATHSAVSPPQEGNSGDLAYVLYTSGSTGNPKGVEIPHSAIVNFLLSMRRQPGLTESDTLLSVTTLSFDIAGLELYLPLITGGKLVIATREDAQDPGLLMKRMRECECTVMQATPSTWRALVDAGWSGSPKLKLLCGGESFPPELAQQLIPRCAELWNMYGPTETTVWSTIHRVTVADGRVPIGRPIANTQVFVLDPNLNPAPVGVVDELYIGGAGVACGYLRRPELTAERFIANPFKPHTWLYRTGDLGRWLPGGLLECLGRADNQVKVRGFRIELGEIEGVLGRHEMVAQCVAAARRAPSGEMFLVAYFEPRPGSTLEVADLRNHLKKELPEYMIPSAFVRLEKLPLTPNGKIDRKALPSPDHAGVDSVGTYVAPRNPVEQILARLWSKVLKVGRVGIRDNFFELGGHSLLALRIIVEIEKAYKRRLPLATLLQAPTIGDLADVLRNKDWQPSWSCLVPIRPEGSKPPLFLLHSHGGNVLEYYPLASLLESDQPVYGIQALGLDGHIQKGQSLEAITSIYVDEIRSLQPHGPYLLGGFCFGGLLALEAAQQISSQGEEVALVVLIQTMNPASAHFDPSTSLFRRAWYRAAKRIDLERENHAHRGKNYFRARLQHGWKRAWARSAVSLHNFRGNGNGRRTPMSMPYVLESLTLEHDRMAEEYKTRPYGGEVALFRASKQLHGLVADRSLGWSNILTGNVNVYEVPGHQQNLLLDPNVRQLAQSLTAHLLRVQQGLAVF